MGGTSTDRRWKINVVRLVSAVLIALLFLLPAGPTDRTLADIPGPGSLPVMAGEIPVQAQAGAQFMMTAPVAGQPVLDELACVNWN